MILHTIRPPSGWVNWMKLEVERYSGFKADERPVRYSKRLSTSGMVRRTAFYIVCADDGSLYILRRKTSTPEGAWHLVSSRQMPVER